MIAAAPRSAAQPPVLGVRADGEVALLTSGLASRDPRMRDEAARQLAALRERAAPAIAELVRLLGDADSYVGVEPQSGHPWTFEPGVSAASALVAIGSLAIPEVVEALREGNALARSRAAFVLGRAADERGVEPLLAALRDRNAEVRAAAAEALPYGDPRTLEPFITALGDRSARVRETAIDGLAGVNDARAVEPLIAALRRESDVDVACEAMDALAHIGDARAVPARAAVLADQRRDPLVREWAARDLGVFEGDGRAFDALLAASRYPEDDVRRASIGAFGYLRDTRATPLLLRVLRSEDPERFWAAWALGELKDPQTVEPLIDALSAHGAAPAIGGSVDTFRTQIARSLGLIGDARAVEPLVAALTDASGNVPAAAAQALRTDRRQPRRGAAYGGARRHVPYRPRAGGRRARGDRRVGKIA
jgi:HEAT repeat protein